MIYYRLLIPAISSQSICMVMNWCSQQRSLKMFTAQRPAAGLHLKAHVGEFGDAESVRHTVEVLELEQVQHGISAASSSEIMKWPEQEQYSIKCLSDLECNAESCPKHCNSSYTYTF